MLLHRSFSRRGKAESEKLSERQRPREDIIVNDNYKSMTSQSIGHFRDEAKLSPKNKARKPVGFSIGIASDVLTSAPYIEHEVRR